MLKTIEAIYKNGILKPLNPLNISEYEMVTLIIKPHKKSRKKGKKEKAFGIWKNRTDIQDSVEWVNRLRSKEESLRYGKKAG